MNQDVEALWERVLERDPELKEELSSTRVVEPGDEPIGDDPLAGPNTEIADDGAEPEDDPFAFLDTEFRDDEAESTDPFAEFDPIFDDDEATQTELDDFDLTIRVDDEGAEPNQAESVVDVTFEESADLWLSRLSRSRLALEHALLSMGLTRDVLPANRPLLIFSSHRSKLAAPEYHRVEVTPDGWPPRLQFTEPLTSTAAAKILASSHSVSPCFEGETVAAEVPNPLLARDRWIVLWPELKDLLDPPELLQGRRVRRVVWCVDKEQIGPRDVIDWLSNSWPDIPIRIALFRAASFVHEQEDEVAQSKVLPRVHRTLEKFNRIKSHPWIVVGP